MVLMLFLICIIWNTQPGPTTFDLRAILQNLGKSPATSNKMMYKITDSKHLKLKREEK